MRSSPLYYIRRKRVIDEALEQIRVVRLELHEELLKIPQYRALTALDEILRIIIEQQQLAPMQQQEQSAPAPEEPVVAAPAPAHEQEQEQEQKPVKASKPMTQVQALSHVLHKKETPASLGWLLAELELLGVSVGGANPRKTLGTALYGNKDMFRRVEYDGGRWMWGLANKRYAGETTFSHLPPTEFKSMRVRIPTKSKVKTTVVKK